MCCLNSCGNDPDTHGTQQSSSVKTFSSALNHQLTVIVDVIIKKLFFVGEALMLSRKGGLHKNTCIVPQF